MQYGAYNGEFSIAPVGDPAAVIDYGTELDPDFLAAFGPPALLTLPIDLEKRAYDFSYNGNTGTLNGGVTTTGDGVGVLGRSWKFDGSTGYIDCGNNQTLQLNRNFSIACMFNVTSITSFHSLISHGRGGWYLRINSSGHLDFLKSQAADLFAGALTVTTGKDHLAVVTVDASGNASLYLDGYFDKSASISSTTFSFTESVRIGMDTTGTEFLVGSESFVGIFPSCFSAAQVSALYSSLLYGEPYRLFDQTANERFIGNVVSTGGLLLARRRAAAA